MSVQSRQWPTEILRFTIGCIEQQQMKSYISYVTTCVFDPAVCTCTCTCTYILIETHCVSSIIPNTSMYIVMSKKYRLIEIIENRSTLHARALGPKEIKYHK